MLAHRIPWAAQLAIGALPGVLGARVLTAAIARNAWTFVGSGRFAAAARRPLTFVVADNPLDPGEGRACVWHAAVFERLFRRLVWPSAMVADRRDGRVCRFIIRPTGV